MIVLSTCRVLDNAERINRYSERLRRQPEFHHLAHAGRIATGVRKQAELIRLPIPRHRALVVVS